MFVSSSQENLLTASHADRSLRWNVLRESNGNMAKHRRKYLKRDLKNVKHKHALLATGWIAMKTCPCQQPAEMFAQTDLTVKNIIFFQNEH